jgi:cytochrome c-type biogenesis protein CcmH
MRRLRNSALALLVAVFGAAAQDAAQRQSVNVLRVGHRLACLCGCNDTFATCSMLECSFCKPAKERIAKMQSQGTSDQAIIDLFIREYGQQIYREEPNAWGWIIPYAALVPGLALLVWFVRRYYRPRLQPAGGAPAVDPRYNEQIEKELADLD